MSEERAIECLERWASHDAEGRNHAHVFAALKLAEKHERWGAIDNHNDVGNGSKDV